MFPKDRNLNRVRRRFNCLIQIWFSFITIFCCSLSAQNRVSPPISSINSESSDTTACKSRNTYYYSLNAKYPKSSYTLMKDANAFLVSSQNNDTETGYITFRFRITCNGEVQKDFQILQTNERYEKTQFSPSLVANLQQYLITLHNWKVAKGKNGSSFSYFSYLTFKIDNGKVVNVIP